MAPVCALLLLAAVPAPFSDQGPLSILWTAPAILVAAMLIAWAAESAQFFVAQGFALAILAWLQTLPEFAVEAVLAWHQQAPLLIANLTGALRLLTGLGWPLIYLTASWANRRANRTKLSPVATIASSLDRGDQFSRRLTFALEAHLTLPSCGTMCRSVGFHRPAMRTTQSRS